MRASILPLRRRFVDCDPIETEIANRLHEIIELNRFYDVAVRAEIVAFDAITLLGGGGDDHDGQHLRSLVGFHLPQDLDPVDLRKLQIEKDDLGAVIDIAIRVSAAREEKIECFL